MTSGSSRLANPPASRLSAKLSVDLSARYSIHFKSPTDKPPTHCNAHRPCSNFSPVNRTLHDAPRVRFDSIRCRDNVETIITKKYNRNWVVVSVFDVTRCTIRTVDRSVTFRRFSRHVVAYETLSAWRSTEPTRPVCL